MKVKDYLKNVEVRSGRGDMRFFDTHETGTSRPKIVGYAAKYGILSQPIRNFREKIAPGFFDGIERFDVIAAMNHDFNFVLGRSTSKTLRLYPDSVGLRVEIDPPDNTWANDLLISMRRGDFHQMSFAFTLPPNKEGEVWTKDDQGNLIRTLTKIARLWDVSVVASPAYEDTSATLASYLSQAKAKAAARRRVLQMLNW